MSTNNTPNPFAKARSLPRRLKLLLWGDAGTLKTRLALQFPAPAVIDMEGSADLYGDQFDFEVLRAVDPDEVMGAVEWLATHDHQYRTLVIDPITVYWDALQKKWSDIFLARKVGTKAHKFEFYELGPRDWATIKAEFKKLVRLMVALDMNVVVTARKKNKYAEGDLMKVIGETFDGDKSLPYLFDTIIQTFKEGQKFVSICHKDRTNKIPAGEFETTFEVFEKRFGADVLGRKAEPITTEQEAEATALINELGIPSESVRARLKAYGVEQFGELSYRNAQEIIGKLRGAVATKQNPVGETTNA